MLAPQEIIYRMLTENDHIGQKKLQLHVAYEVLHELFVRAAHRDSSLVTMLLTCLPQCLQMIGTRGHTRNNCSCVVVTAAKCRHYLLSV